MSTKYHRSMRSADGWTLIDGLRQLWPETVLTDEEAQVWVDALSEVPRREAGAVVDLLLAECPWTAPTLDQFWRRLSAYRRGDRLAHLPRTQEFAKHHISAARESLRNAG